MSFDDSLVLQFESSFMEMSSYWAEAVVKVMVVWGPLHEQQILLAILRPEEREARELHPV